VKWKVPAFWGKWKRAAVVEWKRAAVWRDMSSGKGRHFRGIGQVEKGGSGM